MSLSDNYVFGIGMGRTGTTSLADALTKLGIKTKHFPSDNSSQRELLAGKKLSIMKKYQALVDGIAPFYRQLYTQYPNSRFILTVRDKSDWLVSVKRFNHLRDHSPKLKTGKHYTDELRFLTYGTYKLDDNTLIDGYTAHFEAVKSFFKPHPESLLIMNLCGGEGWNTLTDYLGIPMPDYAFPHSNDLSSVAGWQKLIKDIKITLDKYIDPDSEFVMIDENQLDLDLPNAKPFVEKDGYYWGAPSCDSMAIIELNRMIDSGVQFVVVVQPAFWLLDHYRVFTEHLINVSNIIHRCDSLKIFKFKIISLD